MTEIKWIKGGTDNSYLVTDGTKAILVDTASRQNLDQVIAECDKYEMKLIVLTHVHFDHAENAAELSGRYGIPVAVHRKDEELFESYDRQPMKSSGPVGRVVLGLSLKVLRNTPVKRPENLVYVREGDDLGAYGFDAKIIELPGHTLGSVGVDVEGKHLIVGDALDNWIRPGVAHLFHDRGAARKSAEKIRALGDRTVYYGHGKPTKNGIF